jgi:hypothetical protein
MDIRALVLVKTAAEILADPAPISFLSPALLEVAGKSALQRTLERLRQFGLQPVTVIADSEVPPAHATNGHRASYLSAARERFWRSAENAFNDMAQDGAELVLLINLVEYAEIDFERLVQFHLDRQARVSQACWGAQPLQVFCVSASRRNDAASLFRSQLGKCRVDCPLFEHAGYFNPLNDARDLRQFAIDILTLQTETRPAGMEVRPGVWIEDRARIEKGARLLAPAFVGAFAKVRAHAVITRCSSVEHHAQVDLGTVVENSTILPYCRVGAGLDVAHTVVGGGTVANLRRDVTIEIVDPKLIGYVPVAPGQRLLSAAIEFATYLPRQAWQGLFGKSEPKQPDLQTALHQTSPALGSAAGYQAPACDTGAAEKFSFKSGSGKEIWTPIVDP